MKEKEVKRYRKEIERLKRENIEEMNEKIQELLDRLLEEHGQWRYEQELETIFYNLHDYFMSRTVKVPTECYELSIKLAEVYIRKKNLDRAEEIVLSTASMIKDKEEIEEVTQSEQEDLKKLAEEILKIKALKINEDKENTEKVVKELKDVAETIGLNKDKVEYILFKELFDKMDIHQLQGELLVPNGNGPERKKDLKSLIPPKPPKKTKPVPFYLSPSNKLKFIIQAFEDRKIDVFQGKDSFKDYIVIEIEGMESVIVEKFFTKNRDGQLEVAEGEDATFIVPKELVLNLLTLSKTELNNAKKTDKRIQKINHRSGSSQPIEEGIEDIPYDMINYYRRFKERFNESVGYQYFKGIPQIKKAKTVSTDKKLTSKTKSNIEKTSQQNIDETKQDNIELPDQRELLEQELERKFEEVEKYTKMLKQAIAKKQELEEIRASLEKAVVEMEQINRKIDEIENNIGE